ncbi:MATE family efflux transporter [Rhizosphaericola mali]|uniref:Oligosaccharide flippase family protein n=1 Tax=Rhizosphaericola mali TaxID=2545455 RepID=A0A5P2G5Q5_9BACT|nr:hypothetical protein [Rhizosphaericola mali]QES89162.1 hypothetical protein E0W69_010980 [Rhizosphaericola mali]
MTQQNSSSKIILNTVILFTRLIISIVIVLFSTRIVLRALGNADFGIYSLIAGLIMMLSFLNTAMATSTQRFLSFYQGSNDIAILKSIFKNSLLLHLAIGVIIVVSLQVLGLFLFHGFLNIAPDRIHAAKAIYQFMALTFFFNIISVPFMGLLNAHENQLWSAIVALVESFAKLGIAYYLFYTHQDKLIVYGMLMACIGVLSFVLYAVYCFKKYPECVVKGIWHYDKKQIKELSSFAGWNMFGSVCSIGRVQGVAVLLNKFFGTIINAAYGISNQVISQLNYFSETLLRAINPQIMRSEGDGDRKRMLSLSMTASKFGFFLMAAAGIPIIFEMPAVLHLWLKEVPPHTVIFCSLSIISALLNQETVGLQSAAQAIGKIKVYQIVMGSLILMNIPSALLLLYLHFDPYWVILVFVFIEIIACIFRMFFLKELAGMDISEYCKKVYVLQIIPVAINLGVCYFSVRFFHSPWRILITFLLSGIFFFGSILLFALEKEEKQLLIAMVQKLKMKLKPVQ